MSVDGSIWGPPVAVLFTAISGGLILSYRKQGNSQAAATDPQSAQRAQLEEKALALQGLAQLELERDKLDDEQYNAERQALIHRGTKAMQGLAEDTKPQPRSANPPPRWHRAVGALMTLLFLGVLLWTAQRDEKPRPPMPSDAPPASSASGQLTELDAAIAATPDDVDLLNEATRLAIGRRDLIAAMKYNQRALTIDATNIDARLNKAMLAASVGMLDRALQHIDGVLEQQPAHFEALAMKGFLAADAGQPEIAIAALQRALAVNGSDPLIEHKLRQLQQPGAGSTSSQAPAPAQAPTLAAPQATAAQGRVLAKGQITIDSSLTADWPPTTVVYAFLKDPKGGPPLVAKKLPAGPFPMDFTLTTADQLPMAMRKGPLPTALNFTVRVDFDGNAMSKEPGAPQAKLPSLTLGASELAIVLVK